MRFVAFHKSLLAGDLGTVYVVCIAFLSFGCPVYITSQVTHEGHPTERISRVFIVALTAHGTCVHSMPDKASSEVILAVVHFSESHKSLYLIQYV